LIDIDVWLALTWDLHPQHIPAFRWYGSVDNASLMFCRFTMPGFLRLLTNRKAMGGSTSTLAGALQLYDRWTQDPRVELVAEPRGAEAFFRQAAAPFAGQPATKAIADCYLAGFAEAAGAHLVTLDRGLAAAAQFRQVPVTLPEAVDRNAAGGHLPKPRQRSRRSSN
jgi:hypothetical protein